MSEACPACGQQIIDEGWFTVYRDTTKGLWCKLFIHKWERRALYRKCERCNLVQVRYCSNKYCLQNALPREDREDG